MPGRTPAIAAFWCPKGAQGKTLHSTHLAGAAAALGRRAVVVNLDVQADTMRRAGGEQARDESWYMDDVAETEGGYQAIYSASRVPTRLPGADVIAADMPPSPSAIRLCAPDTWIVPVRQRDAVDNLRDALPILREQCPVVVVLLTGHDGGGLDVAMTIESEVGRLPGVIVWPEQVRYARGIARSPDLRRLVWNLPDCAGTYGSEAMWTAARGLLHFIEAVAANRTADRTVLLDLAGRCAAEARSPASLALLQRVEDGERPWDTEVAPDVGPRRLAKVK
jgi:hypothetical protein